MPKKQKVNSANIELNVMAKINSGQIAMKPRWYFAVGAFLSIIGLVSLGVIATFLTNLSMFLLRQHGPNGQWRLQQILDSFPLWVPVIAVVGIVLGIWMLKQYDFSYRKNFWLIILAFVLSIILTAYFLDYSGLDNIWMKQGPMMRFYQNGEVQGYRSGMGQGRGLMLKN